MDRRDREAYSYGMKVAMVVVAALIVLAFVAGNAAAAAFSTAGLVCGVAGRRVVNGRFNGQGNGRQPS